MMKCNFVKSTGTPYSNNENYVPRAVTTFRVKIIDQAPNSRWVAAQPQLFLPASWNCYSSCFYWEGRGRHSGNHIMFGLYQSKNSDYFSISYTSNDPNVFLKTV